MSFGPRRSPSAWIVETHPALWMRAQQVLVALATVRAVLETDGTTWLFRRSVSTKERSVCPIRGRRPSSLAERSIEIQGARSELASAAATGGGGPAGPHIRTVFSESAFKALYRNGGWGSTMGQCDPTHWSGPCPHAYCTNGCVSSSRCVFHNVVSGP